MAFGTGDQIARAYWLGLTQYEVTFDVGHEEALIVGSVKGQSSPLVSTNSSMTVRMNISQYLYASWESVQ